MRLTHDSYNRYPARSSDRFSFQQWNQLGLVVFRNGADNFDELGSLWHFILSGGFADECMKMKLCPLFVVFNQDGNNLRDIFEVEDVEVIVSELLLLVVLPGGIFLGNGLGWG